MYSHKPHTIFFLILLLGAIIFALPVFAQDNQVKIYNPQLQINIPGRAFQELQTGGYQVIDDEGGRKVLYISWIALYIGGIYQFAIFAGAIVAVALIMAGGFIWLTSAGNPTAIGKAKEYIVSALVGLVLILFAFAILNTISPYLVQLKPVRVPLPKDVILVSNCDDLKEEAKTKGVDVTITPSTGVCGTKGRIEVNGDPGTFVLSSDECFYMACTGSLTGKACFIDENGIGSCNACEDITQEMLKNAGKSTGSEGCNEYRRKPQGTRQYFCVMNYDFYNECQELSIDCGNPRYDGCINYEGNVAGTNFEGFKFICESDPCKFFPTGKCIAREQYLGLSLTCRDS